TTDTQNLKKGRGPPYLALGNHELECTDTGELLRPKKSTLILELLPHKAVDALLVALQAATQCLRLRIKCCELTRSRTKFQRLLLSVSKASNLFQQELTRTYEVP